MLKQNWHKYIIIGFSTIIFIAIIAVYPRSNAQSENTIGETREHFPLHLSVAGDVTEPKATDRGRVRLSGGTLVADNGVLLRGEHIRLAEFIDPDIDPNHTLREVAYDTDLWFSLINDYHLNAVRLLLYRPPQNWPGGSCDNPPGRCYATVTDALPYIDDMVEIASQMGMYLIIDYHPVGGHDRADAISWWNVLAPRYKNRTHVIYEVSNEPVMWSAASYDEIDVQFEEDLFDLIRDKAPNTHIILWSFAESSGSGSTMLAKVQEGTTIDYSNASVGYHPYQANNFNQTEIDTLRNAGFSVIDTEIGDAAGYVTRTASEENEGVSWVWLDGIFDSIAVTWEKDPKTVSSLTEIPVQNVTIKSGYACPVGLPCGFSADVFPVSASIPITFTWELSNQDGDTSTIIHHSTQTSDMCVTTWNITGTQSVTVTAQNALDSATSSQVVEVKVFNESVYLPVVLRHY